MSGDKQVVSIKESFDSMIAESRGSIDSILDLKLSIEKLQNSLELAISQICNGNNDSALNQSMNAYALSDSIRTKLTTYIKLSDVVGKKSSVSLTTPAELFQPIDKAFSIKCKIKPNLVWSCTGSGNVFQAILIDQEILSIVISAAIDNAIKYTNLGFVKVAYQFIEGRLFIDVHDSGSGIPEAVIKRFDQDSPSTASSDEVLPLNSGYSLIRHFSKMLGATYTMESKVDFGTRIRFSIPALLDSTQGSFNGEDYIVANRKSSTTYIHNIRPNSFKVLVLESDPINLLHMEKLLSPQFLRRDDVQITFTQDASEAIALVEESTFDLIFIDYNNVDMDITKFFEFIFSLQIDNLKSKLVLLVAHESFPLKNDDGVRNYCDKIFPKEMSSSDIRNLIRKNSLKPVN